MVAGQNSQPTRLRIHFSQTVFQPRQLGRADAALVVPGGVVGVEHDDAHMFGVDDDIGVAAGNLLARPLGSPAGCCREKTRRGY